MIAPAPAPALQRVQQVLSDGEVARFWEQGYILVKGCLRPAECERYRRIILDMVPRDLTIPAHWHANAGRIKPMKEDGKQSFEDPELLPLLFNEKLHAAAAQLLGDHRLRSFDASLGITIRNDSPRDTILSQTPHLDCSVPPDAPFQFTLQEVQVGGVLLLHRCAPYRRRYPRGTRRPQVGGRHSARTRGRRIHPRRTSAEQQLEEGHRRADGGSHR